MTAHYNHAGCRFLLEHERQSFARSRLLRDDYDDLPPDACESCDPSNDGVARIVHADESTAHRVSIVQSRFLHTFYHEHPIHLNLDANESSNIVRLSFAIDDGFPVLPTSQMARQTDVVMQQLDVEILAGNPFS